MKDKKEPVAKSDDKSTSVPDFLKMMNTDRAERIIDGSRKMGLVVEIRGSKYAL